MADSPLMQISIGGGPLAIIDGSIYALLVPDMGAPATWTATTGRAIQFIDQASGRILGAPDTDSGTQAVANVPRVAATVMAWSVAKVNADGDPQPVTEVKESGFYVLQVPGTDLRISRNEIEDYSIRPKPATLQGPDSRWQLIVQLVG